MGFQKLALDPEQPARSLDQLYSDVDGPAFLTAAFFSATVRATELIYVPVSIPPAFLAQFKRWRQKVRSVCGAPKRNKRRLYDTRGEEFYIIGERFESRDQPGAFILIEYHQYQSPSPLPAKITLWIE